MKYSKIEILEFIKANHSQRIQVEVGFPGEEEITYDLTIRNWIDEMELLDWKKLCKYYCEVFEIEKHELEFRNLMLPIKKKTIGDFCEFISHKSVRPKLQSITLFGTNCKEAGIFKYLKEKLEKENSLKSKEIKPSSKISDFMNEFAFKIVAEVNRIDPKILPIIKYQPNEFEKQSWKLFLSGLISFIIAGIFQNWLIGGIGIGLIFSEIWMSKVASKLKADKFEFEGIETFRDLVELIKKKNHGMQQSAKRQ